jgi:bifunctional enzyme CysN/CysC
VTGPRTREDTTNVSLPSEERNPDELSSGNLMDRPSVQVVVTGHVDHGKSTVIGRLLADTHSLPQGKLAELKAYCARNAKPFEYAFLLDALKEERTQGITIDTARAFFKTSTRGYIIIDAPGHVEFLKNMVTGASRADAAFVVIDVHEGVQENSRRHGYLLSMLGIRQVVVLVNKMDLVGYQRDAFDRVASEYETFLERVGIHPSRLIPVAAHPGDNIATSSERMPWYDGPNVLQALETLQAAGLATDAPLRLPVQGVYKFTERDDRRRIVAGTIETGSLRVGDRVTFYPSGKSTNVATIEGFARPPADRAGAGEAIGFTMSEQLYLARGEVATRADEPPPAVATRLKANVFWLGKAPLVTGKVYQLKLGTARIPVHVESIERVVDASTLDCSSNSSHIARHQVGDCTLHLSQPLAFDLASHITALGRFVLVDDFEIAGGGIVQQALSAHPASGRKTVANGSGVENVEHGAGSERWAAGPSRSRGAVLWFTGLSGAGKTTIASHVYRELEYRGVAADYLDGDAIRAFFPATGFSREERDAHIRRIAFLASRLERHGIVVLTALISPFRDSRAFARALCHNFIEIHVSTPIEVCESRDVKGLYAKARRGEIRNFTGLDDPYEPPANAEVVIDTTNLSVEDAARLVLERLDLLDRRGLPDEVIP